MTPEKRFWAKVQKGPGCWRWTAGRISSGYGGFHPTKGTLVLAHRYAYQVVRGPIPEGLSLDHLCHNGSDCPGGATCVHRTCVNPDHLEPVSRTANVERSHNSNHRKTHCPLGHEYTPENTQLQVRENTTSRKCIACRRLYDKKRRPFQWRAKLL